MGNSEKQQKQVSAQKINIISFFCICTLVIVAIMIIMSFFKLSRAGFLLALFAGVIAFAGAWDNEKKNLVKNLCISVLVFFSVAIANLLAEKQCIETTAQADRSLLISMIGNNTDFFQAGLAENKNIGCIIPAKGSAIDGTENIKNENFAFGNAYYLAADFKKAVGSYEKAKKELKKIDQKQKDMACGTSLDLDYYKETLYLNSGYAYNARNHKKDNDIAIRDIENSINYAKIYSKKNPEHVGFIQAYQTLGKLYAEKGEFLQAYEKLEEAMNKKNSKGESLENWKTDIFTYKVMFNVCLLEIEKKGDGEKNLIKLRDYIITNIAEEKRDALGFSPLLVSIEQILNKERLCCIN